MQRLAQSVKTDKIIFYSKLAKAAYSKHAAAYSNQLNLLKVDVHSQDMHKKSRGGAFKEKRDFFEKKGLRYGLPIMIPYLHEKI